MTNTPILIERNQQFASNFTEADLPIPPKLRMVIVTCGDARVDPAHILGLELGDAVVIRNNGGRITPSVLEEIATLSFMAAMMGGDKPGQFEVVIIQHTQCGAERFVDPGFQQAIKEKMGIDLSSTAISNHEQSLEDDLERLRNASQLPGYIIASGFIYDVQIGRVREVASPSPLRT